eukprot:12230212-Alexandrium_andersonii.AAC.1
MATDTSASSTSSEAPIQVTSRPAEVLCQARGNPAADAQRRATPTSWVFCSTVPPTAESGSST